MARLKVFIIQDFILVMTEINGIMHLRQIYVFIQVNNAVNL